MARESKGTASRSPIHHEDVAELLRSRGLRPTRARRQLLTYLASTDRHPSAEEITGELRAEGVEIGVATVYQNLSRLVDAGLALRLCGADGRARYDADTSAHDHAACDTCGRIIDLELDPGVRSALRRIPAISNESGEWLVTRTSVELRGVCPECRSKSH